MFFYEDESGATKAKAVSTVGEKGTDPSIIFDHCWWYGEDKGYCDTPWGTEDGGDRIAAEIFAHRPGFSCSSGYHTLSILDYVATFEGKGDASEGYLFYLEKPYIDPFTDEEKQLEASEMNDWYYSEYDFLFNVLPNLPGMNKPDNWLLTSIGIDANEIIFNNNSMHKISHPNALEYSLVYCIPDDIIDPPIDL